MKNSYMKNAEFAITVSDACTISESQLAVYGVAMFRHKYNLGGVAFASPLDCESDYDDLSNAIRGGKKLDLLPAKREDYEDFFESLLDNGIKKIVHIAPSSLLSNEYKLAIKAAKLDMVKYPKCEVYVIDSGTFSNGIDILVREGIRLRDAGYSAVDAFVELDEYKKLIVTYFVPGDPECSQIKSRYSTPLTGSFLDVRPVCIVGADGTVKIKRKPRGNAMVCSALSKYIAEQGGVYVAVSYGLNPALAVRLGNKLRNHEPNSEIVLSRSGIFADWLIGGENLVVSFIIEPIVKYKN